MPSAALGSIGIYLEPTATPGEQIGTPPDTANDVSILTYGNVAATASATNQPSGSTGMRFHIYVYNNTATGTVTVAGKDVSGNNVTETTPTIPINPALNSANAFIPQSQEVGRFDYVTKQVFASINTNGITTSGLTNGQIKIGGIPAAKVMLPGTIKANAKYGEYSPDEHRALGDRHTHKVQTIKDVDVEIESAMYPESSLWIPYVLTNSGVSVSTAPGSPTSLLASTAVSGSPLSLTTQPTAPGMYLIMTVTGAGASGTIALAGSNDLGLATSETVSASGNGTYYSSYKYSAITASSIVITGLTSGSIAITGVFSWTRNFHPTINPQSATLEWFTGSESSTMPFFVASEAEFDFDVGKEFTAKIKGIAQDKLAIGDRTPLSITTSKVAALAQPLDRPNTAWACSVYLDPAPGNWGQTPFGDMMSGKLKVSNALEGIHTLNNTQVYQQVGRGKWAVEFEAKLIYTNLLQLEQFRQDTKQYIQLSFWAKNAGAGNIQQLQFVIPFKYNKFEVTSTPASKFPEVDIAGIGEYDSVLGSSYSIFWANSGQNPTYSAA